MSLPWILNYRGSIVFSLCYSSWFLSVFQSLKYICFLNFFFFFIYNLKEVHMVVVWKSGMFIWLKCHILRVTDTLCWCSTEFYLSETCLLSSTAVPFEIGSTLKGNNLLLQNNFIYWHLFLLTKETKTLLTDTVYPLPLSHLWW